MSGDKAQGFVFEVNSCSNVGSIYLSGSGISFVSTKLCRLDPRTS